MPYFRRLRIIQEVAFNHDVILVCGKTKLSSLRLSTAQWFIKYVSSVNPLERTDRVINAASKMTAIWNRQLNGRGISSMSEGKIHFLDLVLEFKTYGCSDLRDRIFALQSNAKDKYIWRELDYTLDVSLTYQHFAFVCVEQGSMLQTQEILDGALARRGVDVQTTWPSWVPDWRFEQSSKHFKCNSLLTDMPDISSIASTPGPVLHIALMYLCVGRGLQLSHDNILHSPTICAKSNISMAGSLITFLSSINSIYKMFLNSAGFAQDVESLRLLLFFLWGEDLKPMSWHSLQETMAETEIELRDHIERLWNSTQEDKNIGTEELFRIIATASKNRCFFEAKIDGGANRLLCYGPIGFTEHDVVVPGLNSVRLFGSYGVHNALVLRPTSTFSKQHEQSRLDKSFLEQSYRLVGSTYILIPDSSETVDPNMQRAKIFLH
ncbi:hypothetical protein CC86DRAFT_381378 [Ophiobolus disseminans]|uniref:Heterokaryon incompatibility domain-containing protein n=1 Tax=Ophiobolus disseminans TaxID=1469910 RepID=A0A6A7A3H5_9PLEO|nr:hypothetical protein CC86DRAFT_381378 [Ophiobolus disseminans]